MTEQNAQSEEDRPDDLADTWVSATDKFVEASSGDLGARFAPQVKALRALAEQLDSAETYEATMAAEYARMHRWLLNKTTSRPGAAGPGDDEPDLLDMLNTNPGAFWRA